MENWREICRIYNCKVWDIFLLYFKTFYNKNDFVREIVLVFCNPSVTLIFIFFHVDLRKLSSVLFWDRNTVSNTASATCAFHSGDWQLEKKKTKILQNEKAYDDWIWKTLERWNTVSLAHMTGHINTSIKPSLLLIPQLSLALNFLDYFCWNWQLAW